MSTSQLQLATFMDLFSGNPHSYGQHAYKFVGKGKESGTNSTVTNKMLTSEQYKAHLEGTMGLGVVPVNDKGEAKFAAIDLDVYDADLSPYIQAIEEEGFPLVPFRSKSGGMHLVLFVKQFVQASMLIEVAKACVTILGLDLYVKRKLNKIIEVFPKQIKISDGAVGSWINLPYYNAENTKQYAIRRNEQLSLENGLAYAEEKRNTLAEIRAFLANLRYEDGPPCVQTISILDAVGESGGRNNYLFHLGVYLKKKDPEFWEQHLFEANESMRRPLPKQELEATIVSSLRKKDYTYKCLEPPCVDFCRKSLCKTREFGIGKEGGYFSELEYGKLQQIKSSEPYYEWEIKTQGAKDFKRLRFMSEEEIIKQDAFLRLCFRELHLLPAKMKQTEWFKIVNQALKEVEVKTVDPSEDTSPVALFRTLMSEFIFDRAMAQTRDQILSKRVYHEQTKNSYYFRSSDLSEFLFVTKGFRYFQPGHLHSILHDLGAMPIKIWSETRKQIRVYDLPADKALELSTPPEVFKATFKIKEGDY